MNRSVLAIAAHPDDIEFVMAGTLLRLAQAGWKLHYFNIANGCCGSTTLPREECAVLRLAEAQLAAKHLGAEFYPPICNDLEIFYTPELMAQVASVVRQVQPSIILTHALSDYMEDHQNAARLAVFGAFSRGMPNYVSNPPAQPYQADVAVYHAQPHGNCTPMREPVIPTHCVEISDLLAAKREALAAHQSQGQWLDDTQAMGSYLDTMESLGRQVGQLSGGRFEIAEGWRQHTHLGLSPPDFDPLSSAIPKPKFCKA